MANSRFVNTMKSTIWLRALCFGQATILLLYAGSAIVAEVMRPAFHAANLFYDGPRPGQSDDKFVTAATLLALNGEVLSDLAAIKAQQALDADRDSPTFRTLNAEAQAAMSSALSVAPINANAWLLLAQLRNQASQAAANPLKMSYFTGPISPEAASSRLRTVVASEAVDDKDIRLLAGSDVRVLLNRTSRYEPAVVASYRRATPEGKKFLLGAIETIDPTFANLLKQYP